MGVFDLAPGVGEGLQAGFEHGRVNREQQFRQDDVLYKRAVEVVESLGDTAASVIANARDPNAVKGTLAATEESVTGIVQGLSGMPDGDRLGAALMQRYKSKLASSRPAPSAIDTAVGKSEADVAAARAKAAALSQDPAEQQDILRRLLIGADTAKPEDPTAAIKRKMASGMELSPAEQSYIDRFAPGTAGAKPRYMNTPQGTIEIGPDGRIGTNPDGTPKIVVPRGPSDEFGAILNELGRDTPAGLPTAAEQPPIEGARKAPDGFWYVPDPKRPGKWLKVEG